MPKKQTRKKPTTTKKAVKKPKIKKKPQSPNIKKEVISEKKEASSIKASTIVIIILSICLALSVIFSISLLFNKNKETDTNDDYLQKTHDIKDLLLNDWLYGDTYKDIDGSLNDKIYNGLVSSEKDPYSTYMYESDLNNYLMEVDKIQLGLGISYYIDYTGYPLIKEVYKGSGAQLAGVLKGDYIISVNDQSTYDLHTDMIKEIVYADDNPNIKLEIKRDGKTEAYDIKKCEFDTSVYSYLIDDVVYLRISSFGRLTSETIDNYLKDYKKYNKIIIDVRDNNGGYVDSLSKVAGLFLKNNTVIMKEIDKNEQVKEIKVQADKQYSNFNNIYILINENTKGEAEAFAIGMKEQHTNVTLIGAATAGKSDIQKVYSLNDNTYLKLTTSYWTSPSEKSIRNKGIFPDISVDLDDVFYISYSIFDDDETYKIGSSSPQITVAKMILQVLGYNIEEIDEEFSYDLEYSLNSFKNKYGLTVNGILDKETFNTLIDALLASDIDKQLSTAVSLIEKE